MKNGTRVEGPEVMLRGLYELVSAETQFKIARNVFGGDCNLQSFCFTDFIDHMYRSWKHLVTDNLEWFFKNGLVDASAKAIFERMKRVEGFVFPEDFESIVAFFIDCNCLPTSVVGGGPADKGANSKRWLSSVSNVAVYLCNGPY